MTAINKRPWRHRIEELLPWHATGTLSRRDADRVEQALAGDRELARLYELVRQGACGDDPRERDARRTVSARHGKAIRSNQRRGGACAAPATPADQSNAISEVHARQRS